MGSLTVFSFLMCLHSLLCFPDLFKTEGGADNEGIDINIAKGTTDPGVDCFDQYFSLVGLVQYA